MPQNPVPHFVQLIANTATGELTAWPTDFVATVGDPVTWQAMATNSPPPASSPPDRFEIAASRISVPLVLKFDGNGFNPIENRGSEGGVKAVAVNPGVFHYEVSFTWEGRVYALLGCPSGTVHPNF